MVRSKLSCTAVGQSTNRALTVSVYSSGSGPSSSYNSPSVPTFPIPRDPNSQSPPLPSGGIRLPNNPLTDIASMQQQQQDQHQHQQQQQHPHSPPSPRKAATAPGAYYNNAYPTPPGTANGNGPAAHHMFELRRGSLPVDLMGNSPAPQPQPQPRKDQGTGWQNVQMAEMASPGAEVAVA